MGLRPFKRDGFTLLTKGQFADTLVGKVLGPVDKLRDLLTKVGLRPYIVRLVRTRWSGGLRGRGVEEVVYEEMLLPTPKIATLATLDVNTIPVGNDEFGQISITQISAQRYTEDHLLGRGKGGTPIPDDEQFYYEIEFPDENGIFGAKGIKRRFEPAGTTALEAGHFHWTISVVRAGENRLRNGTPED